MPRDDDDDFDDRPKKAKPIRRDRDDDDDDRDVPRSQGKSQATNIVLILAITFLAVVLICGGLAWYIFSSIRGAADSLQKDMVKQVDKMKEENDKRMREEQAKRDREKADALKSDKYVAKAKAEAIMQDVIARRAEAVAAAGTDAFKKKFPDETLKAFLETNAKSFEKFKQFDEEFGGPKAASGSTFTFKIDLWGPDGIQGLTIAMVKEGSDWKIDHLLLDKR